MKIQVVFDRRKSGKKGTFEIYVYVNHYDYAFISTKIRIEREFYDKKFNQVSINHPQSNILNHQINTMLRTIQDEYERLVLTRKKFTSASLLNVFKNSDDSSISLNDYMKKQFLLDKPSLSHGRQKHLKSVLNDFDQFGQFTFESFTTDDLRSYHNKLLQHKQATSTSLNHKIIKKYINRAKEAGLMSVNPYDNFKIPKDRVKRIYLTHEELDLLRQYSGLPRLERVRDLFLFQCLTGLSFGDMMSLTQDDVVRENGQSYIIKRRQKTDVEQIIPLFDEASLIISKYAEKNKVFPGFSNQRMNSYLKELAVACDINKELSSHIGRHSFATLLLTQGMPLESVSHMLGHADTKTTKIYAKIVNEKLSNDLQRLGIKGL